MIIEEIKDNNTNFESVELKRMYNGDNTQKPYCKKHGAMNKVSKFENGGYWRCLYNNCRTGCIEINK